MILRSLQLANLTLMTIIKFHISSIQNSFNVSWSLFQEWQWVFASYFYEVYDIKIVAQR